MKNYFFIVFAAGAIAAVVFGGRQTLPLSIEGINQNDTINYLQISFAFAIGQLINGTVTPLAGILSDKYGSAKTLLLGISLAFFGTIILPFTENTFLLMLCIGLFSSAGTGIANLPVIMSAINKILPQEKSSMAFGFVNAGSSVGQFLFAPLAGLLITLYGWQYSIFLSCFFLILIIPLCWFLKSNKKQNNILSKNEELSLNKELSLLEMLKLAFKTPSFIFLVLGFFVCGFHVAFITTHMPGVISSCGFNTNVAGWSIAFIGFFNIFGSLFAGWYISKNSMKNFLSYIYFSRAIIVIIFILSPKDIFIVLTFSAALGFTYLSTVPPTAALVGKMFGTSYMATLFGITLFSHQIGGFIGAYLGGYFFTVFNSFDIFWILDAVLAIFAALIHFPIKERSFLARS